MLRCNTVFETHAQRGEQSTLSLLDHRIDPTIRTVCISWELKAMS
jgi:hypothetical protein